MRRHGLIVALGAVGMVVAIGAVVVAVNQGAEATMRGRLVVVRCQRAVYGPLGPGWEKDSLVAWPIAWVGLFFYVRQEPRSIYAPDAGLAPFVKALAVVAPGRGVTVSIPAGERDRLSLDYTNVSPRPGSSNTGLPLFRVSDGASAVTFKPCPASSVLGRRTQFVGGFIVKGSQCAELDIQPVDSRTRTRRSVPFGRSCGSATGAVNQPAEAGSALPAQPATIRSRSTPTARPDRS